MGTGCSIRCRRCCSCCCCSDCCNETPNDPTPKTTSDDENESTEKFAEPMIIDENEEIKTVPLIGQSMPMKRVKKAGYTKIDLSKLIDGYQFESIVSLEEALEFFIDKIDQLSDQIKEAKTKCHYPSDHGLTRDESAAIYIYSITGENSIYEQLEKAWESEDRNQLIPWFKYLKLLTNALNKLPNVTTEIWQGISFNEDEDKLLRIDSLQLYTCMGIYSPSKEEVVEHLDKMSILKKILIGYNSVDGKDVSSFTKDHRSGILVLPGIKINKMKEIGVDSNGLLTVHHYKKLIGEYHNRSN